ncbi:MAG: polysaccharide biosynthesis/export family protein [Candidatus Omnitrophica bacterium]|nr:polysaccharide biosynthesis/export family protein [Candidatus Omnitrophota bacterium]
MWTSRLRVAVIGWSVGSGLLLSPCLAASDAQEGKVTVMVQRPAAPTIQQLGAPGAPVLPPVTPPAKPPAHLPGLSEQDDAAEFLLGAGDALKVTVWGYPELSEQVVVLPDGTFSYPLLGTLPAGGQTVREVAHTISRALTPHIESPSVSVVVADLRSRRVSVMGDVVRAGTYPLWDDTVTVLEALAQAGGLGNTALPAEVKIFRRHEQGTGEVMQLDLTSLLDEEADHTDVILMPGDVVYVPSQLSRRRVCVLGEVNAPGLYALTPNMTVIEALTAAGWVKPSAVLNSVMVARRGTGSDEQGQAHEFFRVNAQRVIRRQDWTQELVLEPGDIVYVPQTFIAKVGNFVSLFTSKVEPVAETYLRVYDATNPASVLVDR